MKKIMLALAFAAVVATPALAQSYDPNVGSGNIVPQAYLNNANGNDAYAQAPAQHHVKREQTRTNRDLRMGY